MEENIEELLNRIQLAVTLGEEPSNADLQKASMSKEEYNSLITLDSMIRNDIELIRIYEGNRKATPIDLLRQNYNNGYYALLSKFGLAKDLPQAIREARN